MAKNQFRARLSSFTMYMQDILCRDGIQPAQGAGVVEVGIMPR